jgi:hypothetical protein
MSTLEFLRQFRFSGYAVFDLLLAILGIYLMSPLLSKIFLKIRIHIPKKNWLYLSLPIGIFAHLLVGRITPMTADFINLNGNYILKIVIIILLILGVRGVKIIRKTC